MTNSIVYIVAWVGSCIISELEIHPSRPSWFYSFSSSLLLGFIFVQVNGPALCATWCFSLATFNKLSFFAYLVLIIIWGFFLLSALHAFYIEISIFFASSWKLSVMTSFGNFFYAFRMRFFSLYAQNPQIWPFHSIAYILEFPLISIIFSLSCLDCSSSSLLSLSSDSLSSPWFTLLLRLPTKPFR